MLASVVRTISIDVYTSKKIFEPLFFGEYHINQIFDLSFTILSTINYLGEYEMLIVAYSLLLISSLRIQTIGCCFILLTSCNILWIGRCLFLRYFFVSNFLQKSHINDPISSPKDFCSFTITENALLYLFFTSSSSHSLVIIHFAELVNVIIHRGYGFLLLTTLGFSLHCTLHRLAIIQSGRPEDTNITHLL